jgi:hypothetical protein
MGINEVGSSIIFGLHLALHPPPVPIDKNGNRGDDWCMKSRMSLEAILRNQTRRLLILTVCLSSTWSIAQAPPTTTPAALPNAQAISRHTAYLRKSIIDGYETVGSRNSKWDDDARQALQFYTGEAAATEDSQWRTLLLGDRAVKAGCDDLAVLFATLRAHIQLEVPYEVSLPHRLYLALQKAKYPAFLKMYAYLRLSQIINIKTQGDLVRKMVQGFCDNLLGALAEPDFRDAELAELCSDVTTISEKLDGDRKPMIDKLHGIMAQTLPKDSPLPDLFIGLAYWRYSWDAGGVGGPEVAGSPRSQRHRAAVEALGRALVKDPHLALASATMIGVMVDEGSEGMEVENYFQRAIRDDPDSALAYRYKIGSLNTGAPSAEDDLIKFGRTCVATKRWKAGIPFLLLRAHRSIAGESRADFYKARPDAWKDVEDLYAGALAHSPKSISIRIHYAKTALKAGRLDVARKQIEDIKPLATDPIAKTIIALQEREILPQLKDAGQ